MGEPKPVAQVIIELLDTELVKHQGYATEARGRGLTGLASYYDNLSVGIVECIKTIRTNSIGDTASWQTQRVAREQPTLTASDPQRNEPPDVSHS